MGSGPLRSAGQHLQRLFAEGSLTGLRDDQLLERYLARRDELAFETLVERHAAMVLAVCRRSLADPGDLDDAFQATFLVLARRSCVVRDQKALASWLFGVARRVCLLANRAASRRRKHERRAAEQRVSSLNDAREPDESWALVYEEIERLPSSYRLPVVLCLMEGRSRAEAADALRWTEGMVRGRLARARRLLRSRLIRRGVAPATALAALARPGTAAGPVPRELIENAAHVATGRVAAGAVVLSEGVIKMMFIKKLTLAASVLFGTVLVGWAAAAALSAGKEPNPAAVAVPVAAEPGLPPGFVPLADPTKTILHGRVVSPDGKPVAGARVWGHYKLRGKIAEARTDAEGRFRLDPIELGNEDRVVLFVDADGYALWKSPRSGVPAFAGLECELGNIQIDPGRVFTGQVLDADGKPRPDATIALSVTRLALGHSGEGIGPGQTMTTDTAGRFRTPPLPVGYLALTVQAPERRLVSFRRAVRPGGEEDLGPIRLEKDVPFTGTINDEEGRPVAGATVHGAENSATSDANGKFTLRGFGPNPVFYMSVYMPGYETFRQKVIVTGAGIVTAIPALPSSAEKASEPADALIVTLRKLKKRVADEAPAFVGRTITGTVTRAGRPVRFGWVSLWSPLKPASAVNAPVMRGRTVVGPPRSLSVPIRGGSYAIAVPFESETWYVAVEEPGHALTQVGPITIDPNEKKTLDIACTEGGGIRGLVKGVPAGWEGNMWVVAFSKIAGRAEARVARDGTFVLPPLPPGEYGLKVGHDAYEDSEVYPRALMHDHPEAFKEPADPWKRAKLVTVKAGQETAGVEVDFPTP
jgi:RNA polymerase sigma factor (sigma-70 family)